ncbi:MAG: DMT family transporter [Bacteroidota bacterium]
MNSILYLFLAIVFWALNFHLGQVMMEYVSPAAAAFWRFLIAAISLAVLVGGSLPSLRVIRQNIWGAVLVGLVGLFGFIFFFMQGLKETSALNGALILALNPAMTVILAAIFQGHKIKGKDLLGIVIALLGVVFLLTMGELSQILAIRFEAGDLYFLAASLMFALQNIWIRRHSATLGSKAFTLLTNAFCLLGFVILVLFEEWHHPLQLPGRFWWAAVTMGLPGTALAYYAWNLGIAKIGPARGAIFLNAVPLLVAIFAVPFGNSLYLFHFFSFLLIVSGLLIMQWQPKVAK